MPADPRVGADALPDVLDVGAERIGEVGELVHERDPRRQHRIGRVLGELGRAHVHQQQPLVVALERRVDGAHRGDRALVVGADDDAVGPHEILDRRALLQELRDSTRRRTAWPTPRDSELFRDGLAHAVGGAHRHRRLVDDDLVLGHPPADMARRGEHVLHVRRAVLAGRRAHRDELERAVRDRGVLIGREAQAARGDVALDHRLEPGLVDGHAAAGQDLDLQRVDVEAEHVVADLGQAGRR